MELLRKYNTQTDIYFPLIKAGTSNFAVSADYTHASGDVKISKDGGAAATATNAPSAITMGNGAMWKLTLTATEMQAAKVEVTIIDAATKAVEDQMIVIVTFGNASAEYPFDLSTATQNVNVSTISNNAIAAAAIATDAFAGAKFAADAVTKLAGGVWDEAASGHVTAGSFGQAIQPIRTGTAQAGAAGTITLDASASSTTDFYAGQMISITGGTGAGQSRRITAYNGTTKVATVQPNWATNPSATSVFVISASAHTILTAAAIQSIWDALTSALTTASSIGKLLVDNVNATISSRATQTSVDTIDDFVDTEVAAIKAKTDNLPASPAATSDIPSAATIAAAVWDRLTSALTTVGSIGKLLVDNVNATISSRASQTSLDTLDDYVDTEVAAIKAKTDNLPAAPAAVSDIPTAATIADAVLDDAMTEPTAVFAWGTATPRKILAWLGALSRNKMTQTDTTSTLRNDADSADLASSTISDDGTTFTRGEWS